MSVDYFMRVQDLPGWARILDSFTRFVAPQPGQRTLDVGCGPGRLARQWAALGCRAVGVDVDPAMAAQARALAAAGAAPSFCAGDALALPVAAASFDVVTATNLVFLLPDPAAGLRELARACRPGGCVAMLNPSEQLTRPAAQAHARRLGLGAFETASLLTWAGIAERHRGISAAEVPPLLAAAGLQVAAIAAKIGPGLALFVRGVRTRGESAGQA